MQRRPAALAGIVQLQFDIRCRQRAGSIHHLGSRPHWSWRDLSVSAVLQVVRRLRIQDRRQDQLPVDRFGRRDPPALRADRDLRRVGCTDVGSSAETPHARQVATRAAPTVDGVESEDDRMLFHARDASSGSRIPMDESRSIAHLRARVMLTHAHTSYPGFPRYFGGSRRRLDGVLGR